MKHSLEILLVEPGIKPLPSNLFDRSENDFVIFESANKIIDPKAKEDYLRNSIESSPSVAPLAIKELISLIKTTDPEYAYELAKKLRFEVLDSPEPYILLSELALENNAFLVAKSTLEIAKWLSVEQYAPLNEKVDNYLKLITTKIKNKEKDNSSNETWKNKEISKIWVLVLLHNALPENLFVNYCKRLLDLFPEQSKNLAMIYEVISRLENKKSIQLFVDGLALNQAFNTEQKNLYLGMLYHDLIELDKSYLYLNEALKINPNNSLAKFYISLNLFCENKTDDFLVSFKKLLPKQALSEDLIKDILMSPESMFSAAFLILSVLSGFNLELPVLNNYKEIANQISRLIFKLSKTQTINEIDALVDKFNKSNLNPIGSYLNLYLVELFIKEDMLENAKKLLSKSTHSEKHRIFSWIYRLENNEANAESELIEYRKKRELQTKGNIICKVLSVDFPEIIPTTINETLMLLNDIHTKTVELKDNIANEYGINQNTCFEATCNECCKKTFPYISYAEYLYLKTWLDKQDKKFQEQIYTKSKEIVSKFKEKYKKDPPFIPGSERNANKFYPSDFIFDCPALAPNGCSVYEAAPYMCKVYGYTTTDRFKITGCNYFSEQFNNATSLTNIRKVIDIVSFNKFIKLLDKNLIGASYFAPIPVWFGQEHNFM